MRKTNKQPEFDPANIAQYIRNPIYYQKAKITRSRACGQEIKKAVAALQLKEMDDCKLNNKLRNRNMASQTVKFEYDESKNILYVEDDYVINSEDEADAFLKLYADKFNEIGRKMYIIACIDGLRINSKVHEYYGLQVKKLLDDSILGFARYGKDPMSRMTVRTASHKVNFDINIHDTREQATEAVEKIK